jgi:hypothetical protein
LEVGEAVVVGEPVGCFGVVEASVGVEAANEAEQATGLEVVEDVEHEWVVVPVCSVGRERDRDAVGVGGDHELPPSFTWVFGVEAGAVSALGCGVVAAVDEQLGQVDADHTVIRREGVDEQFLEQSGLFPFVAAFAQRRVGHCRVEHELNGVPGGAGDESKQQSAEDDPVGDARPVTSQRVCWWRRDEIFDELEDRIVDAGFEKVHHGQ